MRVEVEIDRCRWPAGRIVLDDSQFAHFEQALHGSPEPPAVRLVYAASRVVMQESYRQVDHTIEQPGTPAEIEAHIDWQATLALRRCLASRGFAIAEAMDTAQRFSLGWRSARRLIEECGRLGLATGFAAGASVDHLAVVDDERALIDGVVYQADVIRRAGGEVIVLPMPQLTRWGTSAAGYVAVYREILAQIEGPVFIHWLGEMFVAELAGYFPEDSFLRVMDLDPDKVRGAKLSLLDAEREIELRRHLLANGQVMLTGDDFHFAELIAGAAGQVGAESGVVEIGSRQVRLGEFSHALLGILDGIATPACLALRLLARGRSDDYFTVMTATARLARLVFEAPTNFYKSGLAFLAWLDGAQDNRMLVNHEERQRPAEHFLGIAELAGAAGVIRDAELAAARLRSFLSESAASP